VNENYENKACKFRLVFICGAWVGKTSIIDRLLYDTLSVNQITTFDLEDHAESNVCIVFKLAINLI